MSTTAIEDRFGELREMPAAVVAHIEQESVDRRVYAADMVDIFRDSDGAPADDGVVELQAERSGSSVDQFDEDALIERINAGQERIAAQEATEPLDEEWT